MNAPQAMQNNASQGQDEEFSAPARPTADLNTDTDVRTDAGASANLDTGNVDAGNVDQDGSDNLETGVQAAAKNNATQE